MDRISRILVELALEEDLRDIGDLTSLWFVDPEHCSTGAIVSREHACISGLDAAIHSFLSVDPELQVNVEIQNGGQAIPGDTVCTITGKTQSILTGERTALNFLQRLSGVATVSATFAKAISHTEAVMLDTRKTTPGWRSLEKKAVADGGATNHRIGLYDAVMVKDNHLAANPSPVDLAERVSEIKTKHPDLKIEVEADRLDQLESFLPIEGIDVVLLDNMNNDELRTAVKMRDDADSSIQLEASGGVNLDTVKGIAETGVDYISAGALTHSVRSIDLGLDLQSNS